MVPDHIKNRKGARSSKDLDKEVIQYLNEGLVETKNLVEWLAVDQLVLLRKVLNDLGKEAWFGSFEEPVFQQKKRTANSDLKVIGQTFGLLTSDKEFYKSMRNHVSDVVRCWACWAESLHYDDVAALLSEMKVYAADLHFGVREVVIFATKDRLIERLEESIQLLSEWVVAKDENVRRYAIEVLRPVGVWTKKIASFQENPEPGMVILDPVKSDSSKYVQDSVANWINDASKSQPEWVKILCRRWEKESPTKQTAYIIKRGLRTINK